MSAPPTAVRPTPAIIPEPLRPIWAVALVVAAYGLLTPEPLLMAATALTLPLALQLTWREGEPPLIPILMGFLWLNGGLQVLYYAGLRFQALSEIGPVGHLPFSPSLGLATWLSMTGLIALALGARVGLRFVPALSPRRLAAEIQRIDLQRLFAVYVVFLVLGIALGEGGIFRFGALAQLVFAFQKLHWVLFFLLACAVLVRREGFGLLWAALIIEFLNGILGFWGDFKDPIYFFAAAYLTVRAWRMQPWLSPGIVVIGVFALFAGLVWTGIKGEYRVFLNQGTRTQQVLVSRGEQAAMLSQLVSELRLSDVADQTEELVKRMGYIDYLAYTLDYVPQYTPHEGGDLWTGGILHIVQPRLLYPDKPVIDDSEMTRRYTGMMVAGLQEGTSINIGYHAQSYVDFGRWGMHVVLFLVGIGYALMLALLVRMRVPAIFSYAAASVLFVPLGAVTPDISKLLGDNIVALVVLVVALAVGAWPLFQWLLRVDRKGEEVPSRARLAPGAHA